MKRLISNWIPVIICGLIIFYLSSRPIQAPVEIEYADLVGHVIFYSLLAILFSRALTSKGKMNRLRASLIVIFLVSVYGALIEWYQFYIPLRTSSLSDGLANFAGACLGVTAYSFVINRKFYRGKFQSFERDEVRKSNIKDQKAK